MKKIILIPDSFKGTMTSKEICTIMKTIIKKHNKDSEIVTIPVADGGEGSVDSFIAAAGGRKITVRVKGPYFEEIEAFYGVLDDGVAVIEMAACAGLPLVEENKNPGKTTTYGVGELILHAVKSGCKKIIVGLGGSCTNDGGTGAAAAVGVKFFDEKNIEFIPVGESLSRISRIDRTMMPKEFETIELVTMCDIDNPLYGESGAAYVFSSQKGADEPMVKLLDLGLKHLSKVIEKDFGIQVGEMSGAGAAGGMGAGMVAFFKSKLQMGIDTVLDVVHFDEIVKNADLVFSGEGKIDSQSLRGKVIMGVAKRTKAMGVPLIAVVGDIGEGIEPIYDLGVLAIVSINSVAVPFELAKRRCKEDLSFTMENIMRLISLYIEN